MSPSHYASFFLTSISSLPIPFYPSTHLASLFPTQFNPVFNYLHIFSQQHPWFFALLVSQPSSNCYNPIFLLLHSRIKKSVREKSQNCCGLIVLSFTRTRMEFCLVPINFCARSLSPPPHS